MMKQRHSSLLAGAAIAAALALVSNPASAQFADTTVTPFPTLPETAPPPIVAPAPPVMTSSPVVQAVPAPEPVVEADEPVAPAARTTTTRATTREPVRAAAAPVADVAAAPQPAEPVAVSEAAPVEAIPAPVAAAPAEPTQTNDSTDTLLMAILGGLAVFLLAIWGFVAIGRRRTVGQRAARPVERPVVQRPVVAHAAPQPQPAAAPSLATVTPAATFVRSEAPAPAASMAHSGAAVALPRTVPATFDERNALIDRMIAAKPDRANPFSSPIQRRKRAKLILQSLGRTFDVEPWIDLSQYPANWPELDRRQTAAA